MIPARSETCLRCGHPPCPSCADWCDIMVGDDPEACCEGKCVYAEPPWLLPKMTFLEAAERDEAERRGVSLLVLWQTTTFHSTDEGFAFRNRALSLTPLG